MKNAKILKKKLLVDSVKKVVEETIEFAPGDVQEWVYLDTPKSIVVVALTPKKEVVLVNLYRHNVKQDVCELPAGGAEHANESTLQAAQRELREETGYTSEQFVDLGAYYVLPSETNRWVNYFLALDATQTEVPKLDELIEKYFSMSVTTAKFDELATTRGAAAKGITGLESLFGLQLAKEYLNKGN